MSGETKPWWRRDWLALMLIGALVAVYLWNLRPLPPLEGWDSTYEAALAEAQAGKKHILLAFSQKGCAPCMIMERRVLPSRTVVDALKTYIPVKVDVVADPALAERYHVFATPTYIVTDAQGEPLARTEGSTSAKDFAAFLSIAEEARPQRTLTQ